MRPWRWEYSPAGTAAVVLIIVSISLVGVLGSVAHIADATKNAQGAALGEAPGVQQRLGDPGPPAAAGPAGSVPAAAGSVVVPVGKDPDALVYDSAVGEVFVGNAGSDNVSVINATTDTVVDAIPLPRQQPTAAVYAPELGEVLVLDYFPGNVSVINDTTDSVVATFGLHGASLPIAAVIDPLDGELFVLDFARGESPEVTVLDAGSGAFLGNLSLPGPCGLAYDPVEDEVFVGECEPGGSVGVVSPTSLHVVATIVTPGTTAPSALAYDPANQEIFAGGDGAGDNITAIDPATNSVIGQGGGQAAGKFQAFGDPLVAAPAEHELVAVFVPANSEPAIETLNDSTEAVVSELPTNDSAQVLTYVGRTNSIYIAYEVGPGGSDLMGGVAVWNLSAPFALGLGASRGSIDVGEPVWFNATDDGFLGSLQYEFSFPTWADCGPAVGGTLECAPGQVGILVVSVNASGTSPWVGTSAQSTVDPALVADLVLSTDALGLGDPLGVAVNVSGGLPPYATFVTGLPPGCAYSGVGQFGCLPTESGNYTVGIQSTDANGRSVGNSQLLEVSFNFSIDSPGTIQLGSALTIDVHSAPGFGTLSFAYAGLPPGCASQNSSVLSCVPDATGSYLVSIEVRDSAGDVRTHTVEVSVAQQSPSGMFGLPGSEGYLAVGGVAVLLVALTVLAIARRRPPAPGLNGARQTAPPSPPDAELAVGSRIRYLPEGQDDPASDLF